MIIALPLATTHLLYLIQSNTACFFVCDVHAKGNISDDSLPRFSSNKWSIIYNLCLLLCYNSDRISRKCLLISKKENVYYHVNCCFFDGSILPMSASSLPTVTLLSMNSFMRLKRSTFMFSGTDSTENRHAHISKYYRIKRSIILTTYSLRPYCSQSFSSWSTVALCIPLAFMDSLIRFFKSLFHPHSVNFVAKILFSLRVKQNRI